MVRAVRVQGELTHRAGDMQLDYAMRTRDKFAKWVHQGGLIWVGEFTVFANGTQPGALTEEEAEQDRRAGCYDGLVAALEAAFPVLVGICLEKNLNPESPNYVGWESGGWAAREQVRKALAEARKGAPK